MRGRSVGETARAGSFATQAQVSGPIAGDPRWVPGDFPRGGG